MRSRRPTPADLIDPRPTLDHPSPALRSIQPAHRPAGGAAGLVEAAVLLHRVGQVGAKRRILRLVVDQFRLEGKRDVAGKLAKALRNALHSRRAQLRGIEPVGRQKLLHQRVKLPRLVRFNGRTVRQYGRGRRHAPNASAGATSILSAIAWGIGTAVSFPDSLSRFTQATASVPRATSLCGCPLTLRKTNE